MYINKATLYGNLTRDPELRALPSGQSVVNFSIATNRTFNDRDGKKQEQVEYHNIVGFAKQADLINQYMKKGSPIFIEGRMQTRSWDKDGVKQYRTEIVIEHVQFGPKTATAGQKPANNDASSADPMPEYPNEEINPDDIPF